MPAALCPVPSSAQIPYHVFDENTTVGGIRYSFVTTRTFTQKKLQEQTGLTAPGKIERIMKFLSFLPFINKPAPHPFNVVELQRDVARLRKFYQDQGFLGTRVTYDVTYNNAPNTVNLTMIVEEGKAIILDSVAIETPAGGNPASALPADLAPQWETFAAQKLRPDTARFTEAKRARMLGDALGWWMNRGYAFAKSNTHANVDSILGTLDLRIELDPGPRARVDTLEVIGNRRVSRGLIARTVPVREGDWYSSQKVAEGQRRLFGLGLFRTALTSVPDSQPRDSTVDVRIRLQESPRRRIAGEAGYVSAGGGLSARGEFAHYNFTGGARTLRITGVAQTGLLSYGQRPETDYQLSFSFREPLFLIPQLSLSVAPFARYRNDQTDRSREVGLETSLIYELAPFRFVTLRHRYSQRNVLDYRIGSGNSIDLETLLALAAQGSLTNIGKRIQRSTFSLSTAFGRNDPTRNIRGLTLLPSVEVTSPPSLNTIEFAHAELPMSAYLPLRGRLALAFNARLGRVFPFGKTVVDGTVGRLEAIQLRDVLLNAGGTGSVRGWANGMLGPKMLNLLFETFAGGDSARITGTDGYIAAGALARTTASVELRMPFPGLGPTWGTHAFFDAGPVWTSDSRFVREDPNNEERWFYGAGAGIDINTIVGPIRVSMGYKLNPSVLDVRDANEVFKALQAGLPVTSVSPRSSMRRQVHISLGQRF